MPMRENKMVKNAYPVRMRITQYAESTIFTRNWTIDHPVYRQDIAGTKIEQISASYAHTQYRECISHIEELNLWR